jgi:hypothetical protein
VIAGRDETQHEPPTIVVGADDGYVYFIDAKDVMRTVRVRVCAQRVLG